jgi:hypothetical protein
MKNAALLAITAGCIGALISDASIAEPVPPPSPGFFAPQPKWLEVKIRKGALACQGGLKYSPGFHKTRECRSEATGEKCATYGEECFYRSGYVAGWECQKPISSFPAYDKYGNRRVIFHSNFCRKWE